MWLMWVLALFILLGCVAIWRWGGLDVRTPWEPLDEEGPTHGSATSPVKELVRHYLWYLAVALGSGLVSGLVMAGMGGRLAMRILGATSPSAQGRMTEADQIVGEITIDGSIGFILFFGAAVGLLSGVIFMLIRRWLPPGRWRGFTFGAMLLILFATRIEPLRPNNEDFDIVGPGWLSIIVFLAIGLGHGMLLAALAGRFSGSVPLISKDLAAIAKHLPILSLLLIPPSVVISLVIGAVYILARRALEDDDRSRGITIIKIGRAIGAAALLVALPGFVTGVIDIAGRP